MSVISTATPVLTVRTALTRAASALGEKGWTQNKYADADGKLCAAGAVNVALTGTPIPMTGPRATLMDPGRHYAIQATKRALCFHVIECNCGGCQLRPALEVSRYLESLSGLSTDYYDTTIATWNDYHGCTGPEVLAALLSVDDETIYRAVGDEYPEDWDKPSYVRNLNAQAQTMRRRYYQVAPVAPDPIDIKSLMLAGPVKPLVFA